MGSTDAQRSRFQERTLVLVLIDLAGFTRAVAGLTPLEVVDLLDRFFVRCGELVTAHAGRVVKFTGDGCVAVFEADHAPDAVACVQAVRESVVSIAEELDINLDLGANIHLAKVITGVFGAPYTSIDDVIGMGVIHTFRMGAGPGIRISEPVYRKLPSSERTPWRKNQPPATYTLAS